MPENLSTVFCCSGCALAAQMRIDGESFPVTPQLLVNAAMAFGFFNEALGLVFGVALIAEGKTSPGEASVLASVGLGGVLFFGTLLWQLRLRLVRRSDAALYAVLSLPVFFGALLALRDQARTGAMLVLAANAVLLLWQYRGFARRFVRSSRQ